MEGERKEGLGGMRVVRGRLTYGEEIDDHGTWTAGFDSPGRC